MKLDHATIVTRDLEAARHFFCAVAGLTEGPRPPFRVDGYWLCSESRPVIHLVEATEPASEGRTVPRIDHVAFRVDDGAQWRSLVERVHAHGVRHQVAEVPLSGERQLFVGLAPGVVVEFVMRVASAACAEAD
jgi:catechol 2,3-dioxygenase-like lactoylglutathione lyase family enzyme